MTGLGQLGGLPTIAHAVSAGGATIVGSADNGQIDGGIAMIWDAQHGMRDQKAVLQHEFGLDLTGIELISANTISSDGFTIAGTGRTNNSSNQIAWIVTIPEPATLPLLTFGLLALAAQRRPNSN
jgi:uncharacterized membrane protein